MALLGREEIVAFLTGCELFLDQGRPDIVWTYGGDPLSGGAADRQTARIPILFALHNFSYKDIGVFGMADEVIVPTEFSRQYYREKLAWSAEVCPWCWIRKGSCVSR